MVDLFQIAQRGKEIEVDILGLGIESAEIAELIEVRCREVLFVKHWRDHLVVVLKEGRDEYNVLKQIDKIKLELHEPVCYERRIRALKQTVEIIDDHVEVCFKELDWLRDASLISVLVTLRGHSMVKEALLDCKKGVIIVKPNDKVDATYDCVIEVLKAKARHVLVHLP